MLLLLPLLLLLLLFHLVHAVIVKTSSGPRYVVGSKPKLNKSLLTAGTRVALVRLICGLGFRVLFLPGLPLKLKAMK